MRPARGGSAREGWRGVPSIRRGLPNDGLDPGPADGVFGPRTDRAVRVLHAIEGLEVDGIVRRRPVESSKVGLRLPRWWDLWGKRSAQW